MLIGFLKGIHYFLAGFKLVRQRQLLRFIWVPVVCNFILFSLLIVFAAYGLNHFSQWLTHSLPSWLQWLRWLVLVSSLLFVGIALIYISSFIINLVAGPFNSILAEKVIDYLQIKDKPHEISIAQAIPASIARQTTFILYYLPRAIFYLILFFVPLVQIIATFLWFLFNGWVFTMQYLDYPMDLYGIKINRMRTLMGQKREICLGFGCAIVLFAMIPLVNFVIVPVAVIGATLLFTKEFQ